MILIGFLFYRSHGVSGRPGYRIDGVLSRGALKWVTWSHLCGELKPLHTWQYHLSWFLFGFYPCENLELVFISIPNSSSSKTDFIWISCGVFYVGGFTGSSLVERSNSPLVLSSSHDGLWCVYAWSCSACDYLRSKPNIIENGVRMKNLLRSRCWRYYRSSSR